MQSSSHNAAITRAVDPDCPLASPLILAIIHMVMHSFVEKVDVLSVENWFSLDIKPFKEPNGTQFECSV